MTDNELIKEGYAYFKNLIKRTCLDARPDERQRNCELALAYAKMIYEAYLSSIASFNDLTDKTAKLLTTMNEQDEWLYFLMEAMGEEKDMIMFRAKKYKEVSEKAVQRKNKEKRD